MNEEHAETSGVRKLRLGVMGEFSAGKSTLCNLLLGSRPLTERVTATRLSPVWIASGQSRLEREFLDGTRTELSLGDLETVPIEDTRSIRLYAEAEALDMFDLIDFPGISDPNMPADVWERLIPELDAVLWCTHANQAWRQSEAEVWRAIPEDVKRHSLLLITRFDTIIGERDRGRVLARVKLETGGAFSGIFPISLTQALDGETDPDAWDRSGAEPFTAHLIEHIAALQSELEAGALPERFSALEPLQHKEADDDEVTNKTEAEEPKPVAAAPERDPEALDFALQDEDSPVSGLYAEVDEEPEESAAPEPKAPISLLSRRSKVESALAAPSVVPRRVLPSGSRRAERPSGDDGAQSVRMDALKKELNKATASPEALKELMSRQ